MARDFSNVKRLVIKIGSSSLTYGERNKLDIDRIDKLAREISDIMNSGIDVLLVSSGAVAAGASRMNMSVANAETCIKQALASIGQSNLIELYHKCFADYGYNVGQLLLTKLVIENEKMKQSTTACLNQMLKMGVVPIINENDVISTDEIKLGDNDNLSSIVARLVKADLLIILSDIDGLYDKDPNAFSDAKKIDEVRDISALGIDFANASKSSVGTGGIATKVKACENATNAGIDCVIANAGNVHAVKQILNGELVGTLFTKK